MTFDRQKWEKWTRWIEPIKNDIQAAVDDHGTFTEFRNAVLVDPEWLDHTLASHFTNFVARTHVRRVALDVRRHVRGNKDSYSLAGLIIDLCKTAHDVTFSVYLERFPRTGGAGSVWQELVFRKVSKDGRALSCEMMATDLRDLRALSAQIEDWADRTVAHLDTRGCAASFTWKDLDEAVASLDQLACKYVNLLTGHYYSSLRHTVLFDWLSGLREPLIRRADALVISDEERSE